MDAGSRNGVGLIAIRRGGYPAIDRAMAMVKEPKHPPVVYIEWQDAGGLDAGWQQEKELPEIVEQMAAHICAAGLLVIDAKDHLVVANAYNSNNGDTTGLFYIPRANIKRIVRLKGAHGMRVDDAKSGKT